MIHDVSEKAPALLPIFRSRSQFRLLAHLFVRAGSSLSIAELSQETGIPQPTVSREVERLAGAGLLASRKAGRRTLVEADPGSPYFGELRSLLLKAAGPAAVLRDHLSGVPGVEEAYVFGSWARRYEGEPGPAPRDVDLLVVGEADPHDVDRACRAAERLLRMDVDSVVLARAEWEGEGSGFIRQLRRGPLIPVVGPRR